MKLLSIFITIFLLSGASASIHAQSQKPSTPSVKVLYFHGNNRCITCINMEKYTRELVEEEYKKELTKGVLSFEVFNFDDVANKEIVDKYKIESSTILLVKIQDGKEKVTDLTEIGFTYAKYEPEKFMVEVQNKLNEKLR